MLKIFSDYPFLFTNVSSVVLLTLAARKRLNPQQNSLVFLSGLTNLPCFPFVMFLQGNYWSPVRLGNRMLGIEDVLCTYAVAAGAWFVVSHRSRSIKPEVSSLYVVIRRLGIVGTASILPYLIFYFLGMDSMLALILTCLIVGIALFIRLPHLRKIALEGLWKFPVLYLVVVKIYFSIWPDFVYQWNVSSPLGRLLWGIPIGEIIWSILFGLYWPLFMGYVYNIQISKSRDSSRFS